MKKGNGKRKRGKRHKAKSRQVEPIDKLALLKRAADAATKQYELALAENAASGITKNVER